MNKEHSMLKSIWKLKHPVSGGLHLIAFLTSIAAIIFWALHPEKIEKTEVTFCLYLFLGSMSLLYLSSSLYHLIEANEKITQRLRQLDHSMIYFFIAGSITPFIVALKSAEFRSALLIIIWILACGGVFATSLMTKQARWVRVCLYLFLGAIGIGAVASGQNTFTSATLIWLIAGCLAYILGAWVYTIKWPNPVPEYFGFHEIWHIFVILGCSCHYLSIYNLLSNFITRE